MNGELIVVDDVRPAFTDHVAACYSTRANDTFSFALSGGSTARGCYEHLAETADSQIDWWNVDFYWGDERCVPLDSEDSNYRLARESLLDRVGAANATFPMRCEEGPDPYQLRIGQLGKLDLIHLGLGPDGHTASLFPQSPALDADPGRLVVMNEDPLGHNKLPRMTLTFAGLNRGRTVVFTVAGEDKSEAFARVHAGDPEAPASRVSADRVLWIVDRAAAAGITGNSS
jgi:6-phosphogluconolactonase